MSVRWAMIVLNFLLLVVPVTYAGIQCYVCDTTKADNYDLQVCDDTFLPSRGATIESGCAACTKERTYSAGVMFIKRSCERTLRYESRVYSCNNNKDDREYVFGLPGTRCICLNDLCNSSSYASQNLLFTLLFAAVATFLSYF